LVAWSAADDFLPFVGFTAFYEDQLGEERLTTVASANGLWTSGPPAWSAARRSIAEGMRSVQHAPTDRRWDAGPSASRSPCHARKTSRARPS